MCEKVEQSYQEIEKYKLYEYVEEGGMDPEFAAKKTGQSAAEFKREMKKNGYKVPPASRRAKVMK